MKSICFIVQSVYDFDPRVRRKAETLVAEGYRVDVLSMRPSRGEKEYVLNGVNVRTVALGKERGSRLRYIFEYAVFFLWAFLRVSVQMARRHYAIVDVNSLPDFLVFAAVLAKSMGAKVILDLHEITPEFYMSKYAIEPDSWTVRLLKYIEKLSVDFANHVITINEPAEDLFHSRGLAREKMTVIMNTADESRFGAEEAGRATNAKRADKFVMMYHGTLTRIYGLDIAVEALALAHDKMPGAEFWILGSGSEKDILAALAEARGIASKVKLLGQVAPSEIPKWLSQCDVGLLPIRRDVFLDFAFPNKLPEFIIMGKAVIVSRLKAIRHYFSEEALSYFEPNDPADLARQMIRMYRDAQLRRSLASEAKAQYAPIRWNIMKGRYSRLIEDMTGVPLPHGINQSTPGVESEP